MGTNLKALLKIELAAKKINIFKQNILFKYTQLFSMNEKHKLDFELFLRFETFRRDANGYFICLTSSKVYWQNVYNNRILLSFIMNNNNC